jgi:hypothetical protein
MKTFWPTFLAILAAAFVIFCFTAVKSIDATVILAATLMAIGTVIYYCTAPRDNDE